MKGPRFMTRNLYLALWAITLLGCGGTQANLTPQYHQKALPETVSIDRIVIHKSDSLMSVYQGERLLKTYSVSTGTGGAGRKQMEGDRHTPEGTYTISGRWDSERFSKFLQISYPNRDDRRIFKAAKKSGAIPETARIGGAIGIHGEKRRKQWLPHKWVNWTAGCIAVDDDEIDELYRAVKDSAVVIIEP